MEKEPTEPVKEPERLKTREITPDEAITWQESQGETGILNSHEPEHALGTFIDGKLVGVQTYLRGEQGKHGRLIGLLVDPKYRRRGIGRELTIKALDDIGENEVYADVNYASGELIESLPENYRKRIIQRDWYH